jgi:hypothetical protein
MCQLQPRYPEAVPAPIAVSATRELKRDPALPLGVLAIREAVEVRRRHEPESREKVLLEVDQADQVEEPRALWDPIDRVVGERDDPALLVGMRSPLHLEPKGAVAAHICND